MVFAPIVIGCVPARVRWSGTRAVGWIEVGGLGVRDVERRDDVVAEVVEEWEWWWGGLVDIMIVNSVALWVGLEVFLTLACVVR